MFLNAFSEEAYSGEKDIVIVEPKDGSSIFLHSGESMPARRPIQGNITGIAKEQLEDEQYWFRFQSKQTSGTRKGITRVQPDGSWLIRTAHFGGAEHLIRADLQR